MSDKTSLKMAVFGSAFNPPSLGHLSVLRRLAHFDRVLMVPSFSHAWGKKMANFETRCQWVEDFIADAECPNLQLYREEESLDASEGVTTWALLNHIQNQHPNFELTFVIGPDNFLKFAKFHRAEEILQRWNVLACPETVAIRSTDIRERVEAGLDISDLTTPTVAKNINKADFS